MRSSGNVPLTCRAEKTSWKRIRRREHRAIKVLLFGFVATFCSRDAGLPFSGQGVLDTGGAPLTIALTRQRGENWKLQRVLRERLQALGVPQGIITYAEIPCIEHVREPGYEVLQAKFAAGAERGALSEWFDSVVLTSPQAAKTLLMASSSLQLDYATFGKIVCVGAATAAVVENAGLAVAFQPSRANAKTLAAELPMGFGPRVLYPASAIAPRTLQQGLEARGFEVERLNTYTTRPVQDLGSRGLERMEKVVVATFGSPSAVRAWARCTTHRPTCACIGETSQHAAMLSGFGEIYAPSQPSLVEWAEATVKAVLTKFNHSADAYQQLAI